MAQLGEGGHLGQTGVAPLPVALGDAEPGLVQAIAWVAELTRIWPC
jgi:hypothetical protein